MAPPPALLAKAVSLLWLVCICVCAGGTHRVASPLLRRADLADLPLSHWPMLGAHDAGTGYLNASTGSALPDLISKFAKTQAGGITSQLDCGARSFDWRPSLLGGALVFSHGAVYVNHSMEAAAAEVVAWADAHADEREDALVVLIVADCGGGAACVVAAADAFAAVGLPVVQGAGCAAASDWTLAAAMEAAQLPGGGSAVALINCPLGPTNTYDDRWSCTGFFNLSTGLAFEAAVSECLTSPSLPELEACVEALWGIVDARDHFSCYTVGGSNASVPFAQLLAWNQNVTAVPLPSAPGSRGLLTSIMGCWAQSTQSTIFSALAGSSILLDEANSSFNANLVRWLEPGNATHPSLFPNINIVGSNNVCDHGLELVSVLRKRLPAAAAAP